PVVTLFGLGPCLGVGLLPSRALSSRQTMNKITLTHTKQRRGIFFTSDSSCQGDMPLSIV
ncbi:MAG: hypothetical protein U9N19_03620, partial [Thermodesulfobacteriota bacterium]|nr:hypothetical protein [Thermodesulfobacteriota bacterium]